MKKYITGGIAALITLIATCPSFAMDFRTDVPKALQKVESSYRTKTRELCEPLIQKHIDKISSLEKKCLTQGDSETGKMISAYKEQILKYDYDFLDRNNIHEFPAFEGKEWIGTVSTDANRIFRINDNMKIEKKDLTYSDKTFRQEESWVDKKASNEEILIIRGYSTMAWILEDYDKLINARSFETSGFYISAERLSLYSRNGVIVHGNEIRKEFFKEKFELVQQCRKKVSTFSQKYMDFAQAIIRKKSASGNIDEARKLGEFIQTIPCLKKRMLKGVAIPYDNLLGDWTPNHKDTTNRDYREIISIYNTGKAEIFQYRPEWSSGKRKNVFKKVSKNISYNYISSSPMQLIHQFKDNSDIVNYFCNINNCLWCIIKNSDHKFTAHIYRKDSK